jgi:hypothetical protein
MGEPPLEELVGYAIPMRKLAFDHTYVVSSAGDRWGCKGREQGGRVICRGLGRLGLAKCLACHDGRAGIDYGVTGVCYQIANRVLWPAAVLVEAATGYNRMFRHFGHFGSDPGPGPFWPERHRCLGEIGGQALGEEAAKRFTDGLREAEAAYVMQSDRFVEQAVQRMNLLLDRALAGRLDAAARTRIEQIAAATATRQRELVLALQGGEIAPQVYLDRFNELVVEDFRRIDVVLGRDAFIAVFGDPPDVAANIIDPEAFAAAHGLNQRD